MDEVAGCGTAAGIIALAIIIGGVCYHGGAADVNDKWHTKLIDLGCAQHNPRTGEWEMIPGATCRVPMEEVKP